MAEITRLLGASAFEIIKDQIALVLADELSNQVALYDAAIAAEESETNPNEELLAQYIFNRNSIPGGVSVETSTPTELFEYPFVNVAYVDTPYQDLSVPSTLYGIHRYAIQVMQISLEDEEVKGDFISMTKTQRLLSICAQILMDKKYRQLGFAPEYSKNIGHRNIREQKIGVPDKTVADANNPTAGEFFLEVKALDEFPSYTGDVIQETATTMRVTDNDSPFYFWENNNIAEQRTIRTKINIFERININEQFLT